MEFPRNSYGLDYVFCIDGTSSMKPYYESVKQKVFNVIEIVKDYFESRSDSIEKTRVKIIVFRDFGRDSVPINASAFFTLPEQDRALRLFLNNIEPYGGGEKSNALEAIALALKSDWTTEGNRQRHAVIVFTPSGAYPLGKYKDIPAYPKGIPENFEQLEKWWEGEPWLCDIPLDSTYKPRAGRLILFAPEEEPWDDFPILNNCWLIPSKAGDCCNEYDMINIVELLFEV